MTTDTGMTTAFNELVQSLRGQLILPDHPEHDTARRVYNGMIDRHPAAIARCRDATDVRACVEFARDRSIELAIRGGAHNAGGLGVWDDALVIDFSNMRSVALTPGDGTVRVDPGCTWADVDHATVPFGLAVPAGFVGSTGVSGLTLGGGVSGYLDRRYGLTVDNLVSADVVLADGSFVTASESSHPDLFWALRGGGGNFGVVTSFTFRSRPIGENGIIYGGPVLYDIDDTAEVMRWYREFQPAQPEDLSGWIGLGTIPPAPPFPESLWGRKTCLIVWCYSGPHDRADEALEPVRSFGSPLVVGIQAMPYSALTTAFDALYPAGLQWYWRADFFNEITDEAIEIHRAFGERLPTGHSTMHLYPIDGAAARVPSDATAFAYRDGGWAGVIVGVDPDPANRAAITSWTKDYWQALHPTSAGGAYVNFMMEDEGQDRVKASYRDNYARLAQVKRRYDPHNLFHVNQNIRSGD
jgi:FAD/FMN-containing dehydrogenase